MAIHKSFYITVKPSKCRKCLKETLQYDYALARGPTLGEISYALPEITEIILPTEIRNHSRRVLSFVKLRFPFTSRDAYTALYLGSYN